jgi:hypothetical protein
MKGARNFGESDGRSQLEKMVALQRARRRVARASMKDGVRFVGYQGRRTQVVAAPAQAM